MCVRTVDSCVFVWIRQRERKRKRKEGRERESDREKDRHQPNCKSRKVTGEEGSPGRKDQHLIKTLRSLQDLGVDRMVGQVPWCHFAYKERYYFKNNNRSVNNLLSEWGFLERKEASVDK